MQVVQFRFLITFVTSLEGAFKLDVSNQGGSILLIVPAKQLLSPKFDLTIADQESWLPRERRYYPSLKFISASWWKKDLTQSRWTIELRLWTQCLKLSWPPNQMGECFAVVTFAWRVRCKFRCLFIQVSLIGLVFLVRTAFPTKVGTFPIPLKGLSSSGTSFCRKHENPLTRYGSLVVSSRLKNCPEIVSKPSEMVNTWEWKSFLWDRIMFTRLNPISRLEEFLEKRKKVIIFAL